MTSYDKHSDQELIALIANADERAFAIIYQRYSGVLYLHACRLLGDEDEAKDILQELFTTLWSRREDFVLKTSLSSYLYTSIRNRIFDSMAHKKVEGIYMDSLSRFMAEGEYLTDQQVREKELSELIEKEVALLPEKMREIFELSRKENLSYKEIAEELNISDKTVKKQVSNALKILRQKLDIAFLFMFF